MADKRRGAATDPPTDEQSAEAVAASVTEVVYKEEPGHVRVVANVESPHAFAPATPMTVMERRKEQAELYGQWTATAMIQEPVTGANMFAPGDPVPTTHVERFPDLFVEGQNIERTTKTEG